MKQSDVVILGLAGLGLAYVLTRPPASGESSGAPTGPGAAGAGGGAAYSYYDPVTGETIGGSPYTDPDNFVGPPTPLVPGTTPGFSPDFERALLQQNEEANRLLVAEQRQQTRAGNIEAAAVVAAVAGAGAIRAAPAAARAFNAIVRPAAQGVVRAAPSLTAAPAVRAAAVAGAGVALGTATVAVLDKTGALDKVQSYGQERTGTSKEIETIKRIALPLSVPGAVISAAAGRGSVGGNLRKAFEGTNLKWKWEPKKVEWTWNKKKEGR